MIIIILVVFFSLVDAYSLSAIMTFRVDDSFSLEKLPLTDRHRNLVTMIHFSAAHPEIQWIAFVDGSCDSLYSFECHKIENNMRSVEFGFPYVNRILQEGRLISRAPCIMYLNLDVIFLDDVLELLSIVRHQIRRSHFIIQSYAVRFRPGRAYDLTKRADKMSLIQDMQTNNHTFEYPGWGCELFILDRGNPLFRLMPPFLVARRRWDNWVMQFGATNPDVMSIDVSSMFTVIHLDHGGSEANPRDTQGMNGYGADYNEQLSIDSGYHNYGNVACSKYKLSANGTLIVNEPGCRSLPWYNSHTFEKIVNHYL